MTSDNPVPTCAPTVLHLPSSVGGHAWGLSRGERALGLKSDVLTASRNWLNYPSDIQLSVDQASGNLRKLGEYSRAFLRYRKHYDIFHFNAGSSLIHSPHRGLNQTDLPWYPDHAKLFVTYNGCDARQKSPTVARTRISACHDPRCYHGMCAYGAYDGLRRRAIEKMARHVQHMWALNPDLLYFLPPEKSSFLPYAMSSWNRLPHVPPHLGRVLKIIHAPTNRAAKGTDIVISVIDQLLRKYPGRIDFEMIENLPNEKALERYATADIIIDQILIGWYGGFAVEVMRMGKPVIARIAAEDLHFVPQAMAADLDRALINADPQTLEDCLLRALEDPEWLRLTGEAGREYVNRWHDPQYVASLTKARYDEAL